MSIENKNRVEFLRFNRSKLICLFSKQVARRRLWIQFDHRPAQGQMDFSEDGSDESVLVLSRPDSCGVCAETSRIFPKSHIRGALRLPLR